MDGRMSEGWWDGVPEGERGGDGRLKDRKVPEEEKSHSENTCWEGEGKRTTLGHLGT